MFRKSQRWGWGTVKALLMAQIFYRCARFFLKAAAKQSKEDKKTSSKKKKSKYK